MLPLIIRLLQLPLLGLIFFTGSISIVLNQLIFISYAKVTNSNPFPLLESTKEMFIILLTFCTSVFSSSTLIILSFRDKASFEKYTHKNGLSLPPTGVVIANHQIYSDWFFIWFLAYLNKTSSQFFIVMKDSLKRLPVLGTGMQNYNFIFLTRNWSSDREYMHKQFKNIIKINPLKHWMLIFPEGTNMSHNNLAKSNKFAEASNIVPTSTVLLPRIKGLFVALKELKDSNTIIDFTIGYSGHGRNVMAQDFYTLWKVYIMGESPENVCMLVDVYNGDSMPEIKGIDIDKTVARTAQTEVDSKSLEPWLLSTWRQKDQDMNEFYTFGDFQTPKEYKLVIPLRLDSNFELLKVYWPSIVVGAICGTVWLFRKFY